jgi:hypothetical protein
MVYLSIHFNETFFMFQVQYLFVIKLGCILTLVNMFVICRIHTHLHLVLESKVGCVDPTTKKDYNLDFF